jgi:pyrimidine deaminase RibD-like protein
MVLRGGNIISIGTNHAFTHAEVQALNNLWPSERRGTKLVSLRFTKRGVLTSAKPCDDCTDYARKCGVKSIIYSVVGGALVETPRGW